MGLERRLIFTSLGGGFAAALLLGLAVAFVIMPSFAKIENDQAIQQGEVLDQALHNEVDGLAVKISDWSSWTQSYDFMISRDKAFITDNLQENTLSDMMLNLMLFLDAKGSVVLERWADPALGHNIPPLAGICDLLASRTDLLALGAKTEQDVVKGLLQTPHGTLQFAARPMLKTDNSGPSHGILIFARFLDAAKLKKLEGVTRHKLRLAKPHPGQPITVNIISNEALDVGVNFKDVDGVEVTALHMTLDRPVRQQAVSMMITLAIVGFIACMILGGILLFIVRRAVVRPVLSLRRGIVNIAATGDLATKIPNLEGTELAELAQEFISMNRRLEEIFKDLQRAREFADQANNDKALFLAFISHELRTPLTAIIGFSDLLKDGVRDPAAGRHYASIISRSSRHLVQLINDLLDYSKLEAGQMKIESVPCHPAVPVSEVVELLGVKAAEKSLVLSATWANECPEELNLDPLRIRQILTNLVGNAIKFTEKGRITIHCECTRLGTDRLTLSYSVRDTGLGMSPDQISRISRPYAQGSDDTARTYGGTGLGLALSRQLATAMNGTIEITSELGHGCTFTLRIECAVDPQVKWSCPPGESNAGISLIIADNRQEKSLENRPKTAPPAAQPYLSSTPPVPPAQAEPMSTRPTLRTMAVLPGDILVVDDEPLNCMLASRILSTRGHQVDTASDGLEAVEKALAAFAGGRPYKVIFLDMHMPVMDGLEAAQRIKAAGIPSRLVALTGDAGEEQIKLAKEAGCTGHANKPYDWHQLIEFAQT